MKENGGRLLDRKTEKFLCYIIFSLIFVIIVLLFMLIKIVPTP